MSLIAALAAAAALSAPADTLSDLKPADRADLQCMALITAMVGAADDETMKAMLSAGVTFYYGRLQGRTPGTNWIERLVQYASTEPVEDFEANRPRCAAELQEMGRAMVAAGTPA